MINFYANMIKRGKTTLEKVPAAWRDAVAQTLGITAEEIPEEVV